MTAGLDKADMRLLREMIGSLEVLTLGAPPALEQLGAPIDEILRSELFVYYNFRHGAAGAELQMLGGHSHVARHRENGRKLAKFPVRFAGAWPAYDPLYVAPLLQNRVFVHHRTPKDPASRADAIFDQIAPEFGLAGFDQIRALVCDGPSLLFWVGAMRSERYTARETRILRTLVPHLQRRLRLERSLEGIASLSILAGILDGFGKPAFLLGPKRGIECCNALGMRLWNSDRGAVLRDIEASKNKKSGAFEITRLQAGEPAGYFLAVQRRETRGARDAADAAARRWALTARQCEVLALVVAGRSNKQIATELHCAERTVEIHVGAIFRRAQVDNRATLIANVFTQTA